MIATLSIVTATQGRATLERMLGSGIEQLRGDDEWLVVADLHGMDRRAIDELGGRLRPFGDRVRYLGHDEGQHDWGHSQINYGMTQTWGGWLVFQDDDDIFAPDALDAIRATIAELHRPRPLLFRFEAHFGKRPLVWQREGVIHPGMIGGHCLVVPNVPSKLGRWAPHHAGDFDFVLDTLALWAPTEPLWIDHVITIQRPL